MATYGNQAINKRQKTVTREANRAVDYNEFFPGIGRIEYKPEAGVEDSLRFRFYNASERIHGRTMEEWLRPCVAFGPSFCAGAAATDGYHRAGQSVLQKAWDDGTNTQENYKRRIKAAFEFYYKLGVKYWSFDDRQVVPEGSSWEETCHHMDEMATLVTEYQLQTGLKPLWVSCDLSSHNRYVQGGLTSPEASVAAAAGAQAKKALELANRVGAECFLVRDAHEGFRSVLNTDMARELRHYSRLLKLTADYKERLSFRGQLLFQPRYQALHYEQEQRQCLAQVSPYNSPQHSYAPDALSALCFLKHYGLERHYKLNICPSDEIFLASAYGALGALDVLFIKPYNNVYRATLLMKNIIEQGGLQPGGLNFSLPLTKSITDPKDMFAAYISMIDYYAQGLRNAAKLVADGMFAKNLQQRYLSFHTGFGSRLTSGEVDLEDCEDHIRRQTQESTPPSGRTEHWHAVFTHYL